MKGRGCANGHPQRDYITKAVSLYVLIGSCVMDALGDRIIITVDIPGAFLQRDWQQDEHPGYIMFEDIMVEMICEIDPSYHKNVIWSKDCKKKFLYNRLVKAVYGTLLGATIFYKE